MSLNLNPLLARFDGLPVMVNPEMQGRFTSNLQQVSAAMQSPDYLAAAMSDDNWWGDPGSFRAMIRPYVVRDGVLMIPVKGVLLKDFPFQYFDMATGYEYIRAAFDRGMGDSNVKSIAFIFDTPGGMVAGNFDLADHIYNARGSKPIMGFADEHAYSAGYSLISSADPGRVHVARTGGVGSIGVVTAHVDVSKMMDDWGFKITFIYAGAHKVDGNPYEALKPEVKERIQARIDELYGEFVSLVARNRGMDEKAVRKTEALTFSAAEAISNGLADKTGTLEEAVATLATELSINEEDENMADFTQAQYDEGTTAARAEGLSAGRAEGVTEGAKSEKARITAIMESDEGKKRPIAAKAAAFDTDMSAEAATAFLAKLPEEKAPAASTEQQQGQGQSNFERQMNAGQNPDLGAAGDGQQGNSRSRAQAAAAAAGRLKVVDK